ncbi:MAG: YlmC/YmxH family sporulation protein [Tissierellia bacterium]|nr:YlmC/YmxH family sporulation protein [Tissierellia bacterium]
MIRLSEMREKEVINIRDGSKIGSIYDFELNLEEERAMAIIIFDSSRVLGLFGRSNDLVIPWEDIVRIGTDAILVDIDPKKG